MRTLNWGRWLPEALLAVAVLVLDLAFRQWRSGQAAPLSVHLPTLVLCGAVLCCRQRPAIALALLWTGEILGIYNEVNWSTAPIGGLDERIGHALFWFTVQTSPTNLLVFTGVFFGVARWGRPTVAVAAAVTGVLPLVLLIVPGAGSGDNFTHIVVFAPAVSLLPLAAGLVVRFAQRASSAQTALLETREIARLKAEQARLATDVHDVVGHSLAVILAQAESGQYAEDDTALKKTLVTIAGTARESLRDVRAVLGGTSPAASGALDDLVERLRTGGREIVSTDAGNARPLPPELAAVAYRVLQEMLTNALRHGASDQPIQVEKRWPTAVADDLRIEVRNALAPGATAVAGDGTGLSSMRRRLEAVGGRVDVRLEDGGFTATATMPVRASETEASL